MKSSSISKSVVHGALSGLILSVIGIIVSFIQLRLIFQFIPLPVAGIWFIFLNAGSYIGFFDLGLSPTISREISFIRGRTVNDVQTGLQDTKDLIVTGFRSFLFGSVFILILASGTGSVYFGSMASYDDKVTILVAWLIFVFGSTLNVLVGIVFASLYGLGHVSAERIVRSVGQIVGLALTVFVLYSGLDVIGLAGVLTVQSMALLATGWILLYRLHPDLKKIKGVFSKRILRRILGPSLKWALMTFGAILILQTDNILIAALIGTKSIPRYAVVAKIVFTLLTISTLLIKSSLPYISSAYAEGDLSMVRQFLFQNIRLGMTTAVILGVFFALFGKEVINIWLGKGNFVGYSILWVMLIMIGLEIHHVILASVTMATGKVSFYWIALLAGVLNIGISIVLGLRLGLLGIALGTAVTQLLTNNWYVPLISLRHLQISIRSYMEKVVIPIVAFMAVMIGSDMGIRIVLSHLGLSQGATLILAIPACGGIGSVAAFWIVFCKEERTIVMTKFRYMWGYWNT